MSDKKILRIDWDGEHDHKPRVGQAWVTSDSGQLLCGPLTWNTSLGPRRCFNVVYEADAPAEAQPLTDLRVAVAALRGQWKEAYTYQTKLENRIQALERRFKRKARK